MEKVEQSISKSSILETYGTDLTKLAKEGKLDPVIGRKRQIELVTQILCKRRKNNPCLVGEPGVGKTAIAEGLALGIVESQVPLELKNKKVISIEIGRLIAGACRLGDVEERVIKVIDEVKQSEGNIILFIDEVHTLIGAGMITSLDAANILKPALARGELKCIGATTPLEYKEYIETDPALERRFHQVKVPEPSIEEAIEILKLTCHRYEHHHKVQYTEEALVAAVKLSSRYISDRFLPDKAIDLIDEAGSRAKLKEMASPLVKEIDKAIDLIDEAGSRAKLKEMASPLVKEIDIQHIVSSLTGIPVENVSSKESESLLKLEDTLMARVIGQEEAVKVIARAIRRGRAGIKDPDRPIGSFLFIGPTGVGKTELAKVLAAEYFGCREAMIRLDMSEFYDSYTVSKLIGSPPGYVGYEEGGQLTEAVRKRPYTIILFDEIEKAHKDVFNVMLQILDDGRLTDNKGRTVDFKNTLIIMTSNIGSDVVPNKRGSYDQLGKVAEELHKYFRPEFLNRLDDIVTFHQLTKLEVTKIVDVMLKEVSDRLISKNINLQITGKFRERIADEGYSPSYGARSLRRTIVRLLEDNLADRILTGAIKEGDFVTVDIDLDGEVIVVHSKSKGA